MKSGYVSQLLVSSFLLLTMLLTGCVDIDVAIKVNPDGSGTVTETMLSKRDMGLKSNGKPVLLQAKPLDDFKVAMKIAGYGGQVHLLSNQALSVGEMVGYKAVFGFEDINKLQIPIKPNAGKEIYTFRQTRDKTIRLDIFSTMDWLGESTKEPTVEEKNLAEAFVNDPKAKEFMNTILKGLKDANMSIHLEFAGQSIKSNAMYQQGQVIDLMKMDFNQMMQSPDFSKAMTIQNMGRKLTKEEIVAMKMPGMKVDFQKEISIEYQ